MDILEPPDSTSAPSGPIPPPPDDPFVADSPSVRQDTPPLVPGPIDPWVPPPLEPGQLAPRWRMVFIAGWVGVLAGFGALWQAGRIAGIAPWWLGPETDPRFVLVIAVPFVAPITAIVAAVVGLRMSCYVGIAAGLISASIALGDLHFPGLAVVDLIIGLCGIMVSVACLGGRMRAAPASSGG